MQALEEQIQRGINLLVRDESEDENKVKENAKVEAILNLEEEIERPFKEISKIGKIPKFEAPTFLQNLNLEELINWINELEDYFEYEDVEDLDRVKFAKAKLKEHAKI